MRHKKAQSGHVGGDVDDFRRGHGGEKVKRKQAYEHEGEKTACAWADDAIVKAD